MVRQRERAEMMGFQSDAEMITARRMVESGDKALACIDGMMQELKPTFEQENQEFLAYISQQKGEKVTAVNPWDQRFYAKQLSKQRYDFDGELLRPYFEDSYVRQGMFDIFSQLYQIDIRELPSSYVGEGAQASDKSLPEVWHPDVKLYGIFDKQTKKHLGSFYMDNFAREGKRAGAWVMPLDYGTPGTDEPHIAALVCNFPAPTADKPSLLDHRDVETIFHELGHMLHCMLSKVGVKSHSGTSVAWDFVELPSQMNEYWTWEPQGMAKLAKHYKTGEAVPAELVEKMRNARSFMPASDHMRQLCVAKLDLEMHLYYAKHIEGKDIDTATEALLAPWRLPSTVPTNALMRSLSHCISGGYGAGYYSYKWAEVLAADAFSRFEKEGLFNPEVGAAFRAAILSKGDSKPAAELFRNFMGRDPNPQALYTITGTPIKIAE